MRTDQQELHHLYNKHELGPKVYVRKITGVYNVYTALTQCACGDWLVYNTTKSAWEPLFGHVAADFINANPEIYPAVKAYWPDMPKLPAECTVAPWEGIDYNVESHVKAYHNKTAPITIPTEGGQDPDSGMDDLKQFQIMPSGPYQQQDSGHIWQTSHTICTQDSMNQQNLLGPGTPVAPKTIHNMWGILKGKP
jgi:hypothetical protein